MKISPSLWLHNKSRLLQQKKKKSSKVTWTGISLVFINRTLHGRWDIRNFFARVNIIQPSKRDFVSPRGRRDIFGRPNLSDK